MDVRAQYTKKVLKDALVELLGDRLLHEVTVKELCNKAGVNRSTLYAHYENVYALYAEAEDEFIREIIRTSVANSGAKSAEERLGHYTAVCRFYQANSKRLLAFARQSTSESFADRLLAGMHQAPVFSETREISSDTERAMRLAVGYSNAGYLHVIFSWLRDYPEMTAEDVACILVRVNGWAHDSLVGMLPEDALAKIRRHSS